MSSPPFPAGSASDLSVWRRGLALLDARERRMALVVLGVVVLSAISAAVMVGSILPFLTVLADPTRIETVPQLAWAYERFGFTSNHRFLVALGLGTIAVIVLANGMQMLRVYAVARFTVMRGHSISRRLLARYLHQPYEFFLTAHSGDMSSRVLNEANNVVQYFLRPVAEVISGAITLVLVVAVVIWVNPQIALLAIAALGTVFALSFIVTSRRLAALGRERRVANKARFKVAGEGLTGIKDIKLLDSENVFLSRFDRHSLKMAHSDVGRNILTQLPPYVLQTTVFAGFVLLCLFLLDPDAGDSTEVLAGLLPTLGVLAIAAQRLMPELGRLYSNAGLLRYGRASVDAVHDALGVPASSSEQARGPVEPMPLRSELVLDRVSYAYPGADRPGLDTVTLAIRAGERIGIVGASGAGKTTLADILLGLLLPVSGEMRVDGVPVTPERLPAWRRVVCYVPQEIYLLDASVAENIAFGVAPGKIDRARIEAVAKLAQLDDFVQRELPQGYDTLVGERGLRLSGGQRQRIGIARALYRDAGMIVFDEATSALDNVTEQELMSAIDALPEDRTVAMIAHRLSTVRRCDRILVLDQGRVAGFDTWERLINNNALFETLVGHEIKEKRDANSEQVCK
jgi:ATP-binding cassette, subfamily B, bacterial PglK